MDYSQTANLYSQKLKEPEFKLIQEFMLTNLGVKLSPIKIVMVNSRLIKRLKASGIYTFPEYVKYALSTEGKRSGELQCMIDELTTHKTDFYREPEHFDFLTKTVLPEFVKNRNSLFRIWSAGSSTGEEAYTMAMVLQQFQSSNVGFDFNIQASDVSNAVVNKANIAIYGKQQIKDLDENILRKYFTVIKGEKENQYAVIKSLTDKVYFSIINLVDQYKFSNNSMDVVFCRNTLIYFEDKAKRDVVTKLISKIKPGGYLFVGLSETVSQYSTQIKQVSPSVYKKIG